MTDTQKHDLATARKIWLALHEPLGHQHRLAAIAERIGTTPGTARKYVRQWSAAGYVHLDDGTARLAKGARPMPPDIALDCGGKYAYVGYPDEPELTTVDRRRDARNPIVTRRRRDTPGPEGEVAYTDIRPGETLAAYYERKGVEAQRAVDPEKGGSEIATALTLPAGTAATLNDPERFRAFVATSKQQLQEATTHTERLMHRRNWKAVRAMAEALGLMTEVKVEASLMEMTAERAVFRASEEEGPAKGGRGNKADRDIDPNLLKEIRKAHRRVHTTHFNRLVKQAREAGEPLTRKAIRLAGLDTRWGPHPDESPEAPRRPGLSDYITPRHIVDRARRTMGGIDLDPASTLTANEFVRAKRYFTERQNGLTRRWSGRVWLNPPYSRGELSKFVDRLLEYLEKGAVTQACLLVNNGTDTAWFRSAADAALAVCLLYGRIHFLRADGTPTDGAPRFYGQAVMYFHTDPDPDALQRFAGEFVDYGRVYVPVFPRFAE